MSHSMSSHKSGMREFYHRATELLAAGLSANEIEARLVREGADRLSAAKIASNCATLNPLNRRNWRIEGGRGRRKITMGAAICIGASLATIISHFTAAPEQTYYLWLTIILIGGLLLLRGLFEADRR